MKKVTIVSRHIICGGGAERAASLWANLLANEGYETTLLTFYPTQNEYPLDKKVKRVYLYPSHATYAKTPSFLRFLKKNRLLRKFLKHTHQDVVIPFLYSTNVLCALSAPKHTKVAQTIRNSPWHEPKNRILKFFFYHLVKRCKVIVVQNEEQTTYFKHMKKVKPYVVCNPVNPEIENITKEKYSNIQNIISVGRLSAQKNQKMLIDAIEILKNKYKKIVNLDIYGDGECKTELMKYIETKKLNDQIFLKGKIQNIFNIEIKYDLFVLSSSYEGFPNALLEAMALGMPVISTNCKTGPTEMIDNGKNGFLLASYNAEDMAKCIYEIDNAKILESVGQQARSDMISKYSKENCIKQLSFLIDDITK